MPRAPKALNREESADKPREAAKSGEEESPHEVDWQLGLGLERGNGTKAEEIPEQKSGTGPQKATPHTNDSGGEMRLVEKRRESPGGGRNYARMGAARLAAKIQLVMPPAGRVVPGRGSGVRIVSTREVPQPCGPTKTRRTHGVFTSASTAAVEWARGLDRSAGGRPIRENAFLWALSEYHEGNVVGARRLFAAAREPKWSRHCLREWGARTLRTFPHEIEFPSVEYESFAEYGEQMGRFYYGGEWKQARPRRSRWPLWPGAKVEEAPGKPRAR